MLWTLLAVDTSTEAGHVSQVLSGKGRFQTKVNAWNMLNIFTKTCDVCSTSGSFILLIRYKHLEAAKNCYS